MIRANHLRFGAAVALALAANAPLAYAQAKAAAPPRTKSPAPAAQAKAPAPALDDTRELNLTAYVELLRSDLRSQKVAVITEVMQFTEAEDAKFWPVYRQYETQLAAINDDRMKLVKDYADHFETLTDDVADRLARSALDLEARRHALKVTFYDRFKSVLPAKTAARFLQVENQILLLLDLQIAAALPVASR